MNPARQGRPRCCGGILRSAAGRDAWTRGAPTEARCRSCRAARRHDQAASPGANVNVAGNSKKTALRRGTGELAVLRRRVEFDWARVAVTPQGSPETEPFMPPVCRAASCLVARRGAGITNSAGRSTATAAGPQCVRTCSSRARASSAWPGSRRPGARGVPGAVSWARPSSVRPVVGVRASWWRVGPGRVARAVMRPLLGGADAERPAGESHRPCHVERAERAGCASAWSSV